MINPPKSNMGRLARWDYLPSIISHNHHSKELGSGNSALRGKKKCFTKAGLQIGWPWPHTLPFPQSWKLLQVKGDTSPNYTRTAGIRWDSPRPEGLRHPPVHLSESRASRRTLRFGENQSGCGWNWVQAQTLINSRKVSPTQTTEDQENTFPFSTA